METKKTWILAAVAATIPAFVFSSAAQERTNFSLDSASALESLQTVDDVSALPQPVARPAAGQSAGLSQEELDAYSEDDESDEEFDSKSIAEPASAEPEPAGPRGDGVLKLYHTWSDEYLEVRYLDQNGRRIPEASDKIKHLFRCRLTGRETKIPENLIDILYALQKKFDNKTIIIVCGYRSPKLNSALTHNSGKVAKKSLHMKGLAADIRIDGVLTSTLKKAAKALKAGGVGYYPVDNFVHVDIGPVRYW